MPKIILSKRSKGFFHDELVYTCIMQIRNYVCIIITSGQFIFLYIFFKFTSLCNNITINVKLEKIISLKYDSVTCKIVLM